MSVEIGHATRQRHPGVVVADQIDQRAIGRRLDVRNLLTKRSVYFPGARGSNTANQLARIGAAGLVCKIGVSDDNEVDADLRQLEPDCRVFCTDFRILDITFCFAFDAYQAAGRSLQQEIGGVVEIGARPGSTMKLGWSVAAILHR